MKNEKFASFDEARTALHNTLNIMPKTTSVLKAEKVFNSSMVDCNVSVDDKGNKTITQKTKNDVVVPKGFTTILSKQDIIRLKIGRDKYGWILRFDSKNRRIFITFKGEGYEWMIVKKLYIFNEDTHKQEYHPEDGLIYATMNNSSGTVSKKFLGLLLDDAVAKFIKRKI